MFLLLSCLPPHFPADSAAISLDTTAPTLRPDDFLPVARDTSTYASLGYELLSYQLSPTAPDPYQTLYEDAPSFYLYRPLSGATVPLLVWFHGGAAGDDTGLDAPPGNCSREAVDEMTSQILENPSPMAGYLAREGWALAIPRNEWCDLWMGRGKEDAVDPIHHYGYYHVQRMLEFLEAGGGGLEFPQRYAWGTSAGGAAAIAVAAQMGGFSGVIADSPPCVQRLNEAELPYVVHHIFGDPARDPAAQARIDGADCEQLVTSGAVDFPIYLSYNRQDVLVGVQHPLRLAAALESSTVRHGIHDFDHDGPPPQNHVQSRIGTLPMGYTAGAMLEFLKGAQLSWVEAESRDCACSGNIITGEETVLFSGGAGIAASTPTRLYEGPVPAAASTVILVARVPGAGGMQETMELGSLNYEDVGGVQRLTLTAGMFRELSDGQPVSDLVPQFYATRLHFTPQGEGRVSLTVTGPAEVQVDALVYLE